MKTTTRHFTSFGNLGLVQVKDEPETTFRFSPAGPQIKAGGLVITESTDMGVVGKLTALNNTELYLLLTDADVLAGAKQNRVLNKSVLLAPMSKTILDVSCVERGRWNYSGKNFSSPENTADPDLRREKARSIANKKMKPQDIFEDTQAKVWSHVSIRMSAMNYRSATDSYSEMQNYHMSKVSREFPVCEPEEGCNGLAVMLGSKVVCTDIFGTAEVYRYYFPMLRDSAFRMAVTGSEVTAPDIHEAFYRVLETLDTFAEARRIKDETYAGAGSFSITGNDNLVGFELTAENEIIHSVMFSK